MDAFSARGRQRPQQHTGTGVSDSMLVEPESQADPKFQTPLAYTRMTAKAAQRASAWLQ